MRKSISNVYIQDDSIFLSLFTGTRGHIFVISHWGENIKD